MADNDLIWDYSGTTTYTTAKNFVANSRMTYMNNTFPVERDPQRQQGWDLGAGAQSMIFYGAPCQRIKTGQATIQVVYGCD